MNQESNNLETKNQPQPISKTLTTEELIRLIYKGESTPQDERFVAKENGGIFRYFDLSEITNTLSRSNNVYPVLELEDKIIGIAELEEKPGGTNAFWIKFLSIDPLYQGMGYGSKLAEEIFRFAKENGLSLETSSYSKVGYEKLKRVFGRLAREMSVNFTDTENKI